MSHTRNKGVNPYFFMAGAIVSSCLLLFSLDKDTHGITDLLKPDNQVALIVYAVPTFIICTGLFRLFNRVYSPGKSAIRALATGIPAGLLFMICLLLALR